MELEIVRIKEAGINGNSYGVIDVIEETLYQPFRKVYSLFVNGKCVETNLSKRKAMEKIKQYNQGEKEPRFKNKSKVYNHKGKCFIAD